MPRNRAQPDTFQGDRAGPPPPGPPTCGKKDAIQWSRLALAGTPVDDGGAVLQRHFELPPEHLANVRLCGNSGGVGTRERSTCSNIPFPEPLHMQKFTMGCGPKCSISILLKFPSAHVAVCLVLSSLPGWRWCPPMVLFLNASNWRFMFL